MSANPREYLLLAATSLRAHAARRDLFKFQIEIIEWNLCESCYYYFSSEAPRAGARFHPRKRSPLPKPRSLKNPIIPATATRRSSRRRPSVIFLFIRRLSSTTSPPRRAKWPTVTSASAKISRPGTFLPGSRAARLGRWLTIADTESVFNTLTTGRGIHGIFSVGDFLRVVGHGLRFGVW